MRALALCALDIPYIRDNWADALRHTLADDVTLVNVSAWLACAPPEAHMKAIYRLLATGTYDYLFLYHDWIFTDFPDEFFGNVRSTGVKTMAYHPDDEPETWYQRNRVFDGRYDLVATHARRGVERRIAESRPTQTIYLPWGFNPRFFDRAAKPVTPKYDVTFIGKYKVHDHDTTLFREDGQRRDEALLKVAALCRKRGWRLGLFGYGWEKHPQLAAYAGGLLSHDDMIRVYHQSRIVLNPGWTADEGAPQPQTKLRHFEVPGCGAFQITNHNPELADLFKAGKEVVFYKDNKDLCAKVAYYLSHEKERKAIAAAGYKRAHAEHTLDHRVTTLFDEAQQRWPARRSVAKPRPMPRVQTFRLTSIDDVQLLRDRIAADPTLLDACDLVHVLGCDGDVAQTGYQALRDWWHADAQIFSGRSFYQIPNRARNPLQPTRAEIAGGFLGEHAAVERIPVWQRRELFKRVISVADTEQVRFLLNYVARPKGVLALLDAFLSDDWCQIDALQPLPTGLVFAELLVRIPEPAPDSPGAPGPDFVRPLKTVLRQAAALNQTVAIYGARGDMAEAAFEVVRNTNNVKLVALFDRAMAGRQVAGVPVYSSFDLRTVQPDVLLIAAAYSGPAIYEQLKPLEPQMALVPLYDVKAAAWNVLIPQ
jgi:glycosyltransferase involved in cell wall biosynthesis